jgi:hypothetical protein
MSPLKLFIKILIEVLREEANYIDMTARDMSEANVANTLNRIANQIEDKTQNL